MTASVLTNIGEPGLSPALAFTAGVLVSVYFLGVPFEKEKDAERFLTVEYNGVCTGGITVIPVHGSTTGQSIADFIRHTMCKDYVYLSGGRITTLSGDSEDIYINGKSAKCSDLGQIPVCKIRSVSFTTRQSINGMRGKSNVVSVVLRKSS